MWQDEVEYREQIVAKVDTHVDGYTVRLADDTMLSFPGRDITPQVGDTIRIIPGRLQEPTRGVIINGQVIFYRTEDEQAVFIEYATRMAQKRNVYTYRALAELYAQRIRLLPEEFRLRISGFRDRGGIVWSQRFEAIELFCSEQAVLASKVEWDLNQEVGEYWDADDAKWLEKIPEWSDAHSPVTRATTWLLLVCYLHLPEDVVRIHAAYCPVYGCRECCCPPSMIDRLINPEVAFVANPTDPGARVWHGNEETN